jgi:hypothetical protein
MSGADYTLPERIYTEAFLEGVKAEKFGNLLPGYADRNRAKKWLNDTESGQSSCTTQTFACGAGRAEARPQSLRF